MRCTPVIVTLLFCLSPFNANANNDQVQHEIRNLKKQTQALQIKLNTLQAELDKAQPSRQDKKKIPKQPNSRVHDSYLTVKSLNGHPDSVEFNPAAFMADGHAVTYIAGMPVVTSPYLGDLPAFDGSDFIVNISSINRDVRLMQQRRRLYQSFEKMGYPSPNLPIMALSGKVEPIGSWNRSTFSKGYADWDLGSGELDAAAAVNETVEAYIALAYDSSPPSSGGQRVANSSVNLNLGFVNIGDLNQSPFYLTAGQLYVPFGRFSSSMISAPLSMIMARTKARPLILGYKSQGNSGPFAAAYAFKSDTTLGNSATGGLNLGYVFNTGRALGEIGASVISSMNDARGIQYTGSTPGTTFGGFASITNGNEQVHKVPGVGVHGSVGFERYSLTAEWVSSIGRFREQDLSYNGRGAQLQAAQLEAGMTFMTLDRPSSIGLGYQWSKDTLALNLPEHRIGAVYNISIWKDTVESLEYHHDINFSTSQFANGAAPIGSVNAITYGTGGVSDTVLAQIGVYF